MLNVLEAHALPYRGGEGYLHANTIQDELPFRGSHTKTCYPRGNVSYADPLREVPEKA